MLNINNKLSEKKIFQSNKEIVERSSEVEKLNESVESLREKNDRLMERSSKLAMSNKAFEKENDQLTNKIKEAAEIMKQVKEEKALREKEDAKIAARIKQLEETIEQLETLNEELVDNYDNQSKRYDKLQEAFETYKQDVNDTYNPVAHMVPKFEERVGKFMNLRENRGVEVEAYWADLNKKYGESTMKEYEQQIRGAKTLREATQAFFRNRTAIDPDFAVGQPAEYAYRNRGERAVLYEAQGIVNPLQSYNESTLEQKNEDFLKKLAAGGLE